jgi:single-strand DNA-binding protein
MILTGLVRLGRDASLRYLGDGTPVLNMALAYNWGTNGKRASQWVDAALFGKRAEALAPHLLKGTALDVALDDVRLDEWTRQDGTPGKPKLVGRVVVLEFAGRAAGADSAPAAAPAQPAAAPADAGVDPFDDVPF